MAQAISFDRVYDGTAPGGYGIEMRKETADR